MEISQCGNLLTCEIYLLRKFAKREKKILSGASVNRLDSLQEMFIIPGSKRWKYHIKPQSPSSIIRKVQRALETEVVTGWEYPSALHARAKRPIDPEGSRVKELPRVDLGWYLGSPVSTFPPGLIENESGISEGTGGKNPIHT